MKKVIALVIFLTTVLGAPAAFAGHGGDWDAALGGGLGGAAGSVVGNEIGDRTGAIIGGALGAALGAGITTHGTHYRDRGYNHRGYGHRQNASHYYHGRRHFCPPGLAKQGRC